MSERWLRLPVALRVLVALVVAAGLGQVERRVHEAWQYQPVEVALRAAHNARTPVTVLPDRVARAWTDRSVTEDAVRLRWAPGNAYFEPLFLALHEEHGSALETGDRCFYFPVGSSPQVSGARVAAVERLCFRGRFREAYSQSLVSVLGP